MGTNVRQQTIRGVHLKILEMSGRIAEIMKTSVH
jgi:hypothetical protein